MAAMAFVVASCGEDEPQVNAPRTLLIYMVSNNTLGSQGCDTKDLDEISAAVAAGALGNGSRLMVFVAPTDGTQTLYEVQKDGSFKAVRSYDNTKYAISAARMTRVMDDARAAAPADRYGLVMWSHAMGWTQNGQIETKTWGDDRGHAMNITALAGVLEGQPFDYVYFDCCFMGCVEVAYQLRHAVDTMVASASEIPLDGMPYEANLPLLLAPGPDLVQAARNTFAYYNALSDPADRTCTISVLDLARMDALAGTARDMYSRCPRMSLNTLGAVQRLSDAAVCPFFDMGSYIDALDAANDPGAGYARAVSEAIDRVVVWDAHTPRLWNVLDINTFCGISTYVPRTPADIAWRNYTQLDWYRDVTAAFPVFNTPVNNP